MIFIAFYSAELFSKRTVPYFLIPGPPDDVAIRAIYFWFFIRSNFIDPIILIRTDTVFGFSFTFVGLRIFCAESKLSHSNLYGPNNYFFGFSFWDQPIIIQILSPVGPIFYLCFWPFFGLKFSFLILYLLVLNYSIFLTKWFQKFHSKICSVGTNLFVVLLVTTPQRLRRCATLPTYEIFQNSKKELLKLHSLTQLLLFFL